jgi:glycosyltransferase involved in cell wall biosynthesis
MNPEPRILMMGSVPLAAPWNGADKNLARFLVMADSVHQFIVQTDKTEQWDGERVFTVRDRLANPMPTPGQKFRAFAYLLRQSRSVDLVHVVASLQSPSRWSMELMRGWKRLYRKPVVQTIPSIGDNPIRQVDYFGDVVVVVSEHTRGRLVNAGIKNVGRVYPPVDARLFQPKSDPEAVRAKFDLGERAVLYPAHYGPTSGIMEMIQAFAQLPPELDDAVLALACRTHPNQDAAQEAEQVHQQAVQAGIGDRVRIIPVVDDMPALMEACAITALVPGKLASKMDIPLVCLESLLVGRPIIVADTPPMNEALLDACGHAVHYGNIPALTQALTTLLSSADYRARLGENGRRAVLEKCTPKQIIDEYQVIYQQVMNKI